MTCPACGRPAVVLPRLDRERLMWVCRGCAPVLPRKDDTR